MPSLAQLLAPLALLLVPSPRASELARAPAAGRSLVDPFGAVEDGTGESDWSLAVHADGPPLLAADRLPAGAFDPQTWNQVRIEQHLTIRISPGPMPRGFDLAAPPPPPAQRAPDRRQLRCVAMAGLAGVRLSGANQLMLLLRDDHLVRATLPRICGASAFYSGFYVEPTTDGMLCARRDVIHSRAGASCSISRLDLVDYGN